MKLTLDKLKHYEMGDDYYANEYGEVFFNKDTGYGHVKRMKHEKVKHFINKYNYVEYILKDRKGKRKHIQAHRIVASLFIPQLTCEQKYVNHIDGNKHNNHISNLEWCTASENEKHSYQVLGKQNPHKDKKLPSGKEYRGTIRSVASYTIEGTLVKEYFNPTEAEQDGYSLKQISAVCNGKQKTHKTLVWKYLKKKGELNES